jgi:hypothetical protein
MSGLSGRVETLRRNVQVAVIIRGTEARGIDRSDNMMARVDGFGRDHVVVGLKFVGLARLMQGDVKTKLRAFRSRRVTRSSILVMNCHCSDLGFYRTL